MLFHLFNRLLRLISRHLGLLLRISTCDVATHVVRHLQRLLVRDFTVCGHPQPVFRDHLGPGLDALLSDSVGLLEVSLDPLAEVGRKEVVVVPANPALSILQEHIFCDVVKLTVQIPMCGSSGYGAVHLGLPGSWHTGRIGVVLVQHLASSIERHRSQARIALLLGLPHAAPVLCVGRETQHSLALSNQKHSGGSGGHCR
mmetsp:Transcript_64734/g.173388  ORF Transcript_64734/g.173388 Transcript_64734/m.173388 type:complete len:200 (+) Transcript_64734:2694-3293(+)